MDAIDKQLLKGERLVWKGAPTPGVFFRPIDIFLIPFSVFWAGFAIFWNGAVWLAPSSDIDWLFKLWGLPFLVAGAYITVGRFLHDAKIRRHLAYGVTSQRVLIVRRKRSGNVVRAFDLTQLSSMELQEKNDGLGSIIFEQQSMFGMNAGVDFWIPALNLARFDRIESPRRIYELIQEQRSARRQ